MISETTHKYKRQLLDRDWPVIRLWARMPTSSTTGLTISYIAAYCRPCTIIAA